MLCLGVVILKYSIKTIYFKTIFVECAVFRRHSINVSAMHSASANIAAAAAAADVGSVGGGPGGPGGRNTRRRQSIQDSLQSITKSMSA
jgi:hypothetical protein